MIYGFRNNSFVCLDEVTGEVEQLNYVIYNPTKDDVSERKRILHKHIKEALDVELTEEQLEMLTAYDVEHLHEFIYQLQQILYR